MDFDVIETYLILLCSWDKVQELPEIGFTISQAVVEICAIELGDRQYTIQYCNLMNQGCRGKDLMPL